MGQSVVETSIRESLGVWDDIYCKWYCSLTHTYCLGAG